MNLYLLSGCYLLVYTCTLFFVGLALDGDNFSDEIDGLQRLSANVFTETFTGLVLCASLVLVPLNVFTLVLLIREHMGRIAHYYHDYTTPARPVARQTP